MEAKDDVKTSEAAPTRRSGGCCGGPAKERADACCVKDEEAKDAGAEGCGCSTPAKKTGGCCG